MKTSACLLVLAFACRLIAAVDGTVVNQTTGQPAAGVAISLVRPGQNGMTPVGSAKTDAQGKFRFETTAPAAGPQLLQANYGGINYNKLLTPNMPTSDIAVDVYDSTGNPSVARVAQRMLIFEPSTSELALNETVMLENKSKTTFHDRKDGDFRFFLPPAANGQVRISAQGPGGMPLPRPAEKTAEKDVFKIDFPIKPGETQFEISYHLPAGSPFQFHGRVVNLKGMEAGPLRLVAPQGVELSGNDIQKLGTEPKTQASVYSVVAPGLFNVDVTGTGSLRGPEQAAGADESDSPPLREDRPQIYAHLPWLLTFIFAILGVGLVYLYRISPRASTPAR